MTFNQAILFGKIDISLYTIKTVLEAHRFTLSISSQLYPYPHKFNEDDIKLFIISSSFSIEDITEFVSVTKKYKLKPILLLLLKDLDENQKYNKIHNQFYDVIPSYSDQQKTDIIIRNISELIQLKIGSWKSKQINRNDIQIFNDEMLNQSQKIAHIGGWHLDTEANSLFWTDELYRIFGLKPQEIEPEYSLFLSVLPENDREIIDSYYQKCLRENKEFQLVHQVVRPDGSRRIVHQKANQIIDENGQRAYAIGTVHDITDTISSHTELREISGRYKTLFQLSPSGILIEDSEGKIIDINQSFCESLGYTYEELVGKNVSLIADPNLSNNVSENINRILNGEKLEHVVKSLKKDGSFCNMELREAPLTLADGHLGIISTAHDITDRLKAEEAIRTQLNKIEFLASTSMELVNLPIEIDIFEFIGDKICQLENDCLIIISEYIEQARKLRIRTIKGLTDDYKKVLNITDISRVEFESHADDKINLQEGLLKKLSSEMKLHTSNKTSNEFSNQFSKLLNTHDIYSMDFIWGDEPFGNLIIITPDQKRIQHNQVIQALLRQVSIVMKNRNYQQILVEKQERYDRAVVSGKVGVWELNIETKYMYIDPNLKYMLGYEDEEINNQLSDWIKYVHPDYQEKFGDNIDRYIANDGPDLVDEVQMVHFDKSIRWYLFRGRSVRDKDGVFRHITGTAIDITEKKIADEKLMNEESRYRDLYKMVRSISDNIPDMILVKDLQGKISFTNKAMSDQLLFTETPFKSEGKMLTSLIDLEKEKHADNTDWFTIDADWQKNDAITIERKINTRNSELGNIRGSFVYFDAYRVPIWDDDGTLTSLLYCARDITEKHRIEQELLKKNVDLENSERRYKSLFEESPIPLWEEDFTELMSHFEQLSGNGVIDFESYLQKHPEAVSKFISMIKITDINKSVLHLYNAKSKSQLLNQLSNTYTSDRQTVYVEEFVSLFSGNSVFESETTIKTLTGEKRIINLKLSISKTSTHEKDYSKGLVATIDITDKKLALKELFESRQLSKAIIDGSPIGITARDKFGTLLSANDAWLKIFGYNHSEIQNLFTQRQQLKFDKRDSYLGFWTEKVRKIYEKGGELTIPELKLLKPKEGKAVWISQRFRGVLDENGNVDKVIIMTTDITKMKKDNILLQRNEIRIQAILRQAPNAIFVINGDGQIMKANNKACEYLGYSESELMKKNFEEINSQINKSGRISKWKYLQSNSPIVFRNTYVRKDGTEFNSETSLGTLQVEKEVLFLGISIDITDRISIEEERKNIREKLEKAVKDRTYELEEISDALTMMAEDSKETGESLKRANKSLEATNKELEAFSYSVSHDLREPLRHIKSFSNIIKEDYSDNLNKEALDNLKRIISASNKMSQSIDDLIYLSKLSKHQLVISKVNLSEITISILKEFQLQDNTRKVDLDIQSDVIIHGDKKLIRAMMLNLLENAWKFTSKTDSAKICFGLLPDETNNKGEQIKQNIYYVKDNGIGFDQSEKDNLFLVFNRLHNPSDFPGTGIGLATVQRVINRHGGQIWADGEINKGASFYFRLK